SALAAFLLWRLKQIEYSTWDRWISLGLFFTRTILNILVIVTIHNPKEEGHESICISKTELSTYFQLGYICLDLLIDTFVTIRLVQILNDGNRNSAEVNSIIGRTQSSDRRTTLFTAVLYWNFLRLTIDFLYNGITVIILFNEDHMNIDLVPIELLLCFVTISQSYLITVDAEIVKVIEGRNLDNFNSNDLEWLSGNGNGGGVPPPTITNFVSIPSSRTQVAARNVSSIYHRILQRTTSSNLLHSNNDPSRRVNNTRSWFTTSSFSPAFPTSPSRRQLNLNSRQTSNSSIMQVRRPTNTLRQTASFQLDKGKFVVVSMQRLTFFEWANMVTGNNDDTSNCSRCSAQNNSYPNTPIIEEIPDIPPVPTRQRSFTHQRQFSQEDGEALLPALAHISQSRRGSDTSTMTSSTSQTKTNDNFPMNDLNLLVGEEKDPKNSEDAADELFSKLTWSYGNCSYIFGYYATASQVTYCYLFLYIS
ncbi:5244_t:CDS:2, partial [Funneliformis geosporum]